MNDLQLFRSIIKQVIDSNVIKEDNNILNFLYTNADNVSVSIAGVEELDYIAISGRSIMHSSFEIHVVRDAENNIQSAKLSRIPSLLF